MFRSLLAADPQLPVDGWTVGLIIAGVIVAILVVIFLIIAFSFLNLWLQCFLTRASVGLIDMVRMKFCKVDYAMVVRQKIAMVKAGVKIYEIPGMAHEKVCVIDGRFATIGSSNTPTNISRTTRNAIRPRLPGCCHELPAAVPATAPMVRVGSRSARKSPPR